SWPVAPRCIETISSRNVAPGSLKTLRLLQGLRSNFYLHGADSITASRKALAGLYGMVQRHAAMLAFVEAFWAMGVVFLLMIPFLPLLQYAEKKPVRKTQELHKVDAKAIQGTPSPDEEEQEAVAEDHHVVLH